MIERLWGWDLVMMVLVDDGDDFVLFLGLDSSNGEFV